jgi:DNA-directed RNA polymerase subunit RPC12/RpoP
MPAGGATMPNGKCAKCGGVQWTDTQSFIDSNHTRLRMTCGAHDEWLEAPPPPPVAIRRYVQGAVPLCKGCGQPIELYRTNRVYCQPCGHARGLLRSDRARRRAKGQTGVWEPPRPSQGVS